MSSGFLSDTNVLSELMRVHPDAPVVDRFALNRHAPMHTSTITQAEILVGIASLPAGKRHTALADTSELMFAQDFAESCLDFDAAPPKTMPSWWRSAPDKGCRFQRKTRKLQP